MAFTDNVAVFQQRTLANLPQAAIGGSSVLYNLAQSFLSADGDTQYALVASAQNMFLTTAFGAGLDSKAADYGVSRNTGLPSVASIIFSVPVAAPATINIPAGMMVSTIGDGITTFATVFLTTQSTTISSSATTSGAVLCQATTVGTSGNVGINAISVVLTQITGGPLNVANAAPATGGTNADTDASLRASALANIITKYASAAVQAAILATPLVYAANVFDPQNGSGLIDYWWCDVNGAAATIIAGVPTLGTTAAAVDLNVRNVLPPNITPVVAAMPVTQITAITCHYQASATILAINIEPAIQTAVVAFIQNLSVNQIVTQFAMSQYVQSQLNGTLTNFTLDSTTPASSTAGTSNSPLLYRMTVAPSAVTLVRLP